MKFSPFSLAVALAFVAGSALAADLPSRKAPPPFVPPPPPAPLWTGAYFGLNAGYLWSDNNAINQIAGPQFANPGLTGSLPSATLSAAAATSTVQVANEGFAGGGQIGFNFQVYNNFLIGFETDIQGVRNGNPTHGASLIGAGDGTRTYFSVNDSYSRLDWLGTVRGRLGWLATPTLLVYGTGGLAYGGAFLSAAISQTRSPIGFTTVPFWGQSAYADVAVGWTAGGGVEWMFMPNWSAKAEYLYYDIGPKTTTTLATQLNAAGVPFITTQAATTARFNGNVVRAGVNYHFTSTPPVPVIAKY